MRRIWTAATCAGVAVLLAGCAAGPAPVLQVRPSEAAPDQPLRTSLSGLAPHALVALTMSTSPSSGRAWSSTATFRADADGKVSSGQAPVHGDYRGARVDGLEEALHAPRGDGAPFAVPTTSPWRLKVTATVDGEVVARGSAVRHVCLRSVTLHRFTEARDHLVGILYEPKRAPARRMPGVVAIGGSGGGYGSYLSACDLAATGTPALSVAYFDEPTLPARLQRIPLEYFATAARLLAASPNVDPDHVVLWGDSRGSEAAASTAAHYPDLVHGVVLTVPAAVVGPAPGDPDVAAWTFHGKAVPTEGLGAALSDPAAAALPVAQVDGPILAVCGGADAVWPSCPQSAQLRSSVRKQGDAARFTLLTYPSAGHFVGSLSPYYPIAAIGTVADGDTVVSGGTALADAEARDDAWPRLLAWLHRL